MRRLALVIPGLWLALGCARSPHETLAAGDWRLRWEEGRPDSLAVGDPFRVRLAGALPAGARLLDSPWEALSGDIEIRNLEDPKAGDLGDTLVAWMQVAELAAFRTGRIRLGPLPVRAGAADGDSSMYWSDTLEVAVISLLGDSLQAADLRDIKPPLPLGRGWSAWWLVAAAVAAAALAGAILLWRHRRSRAAALVPLLPPLEEFQRGMAELAVRRLPEKGDWGAYALRLTWLVRRYLERRLGAPVLEMTTHETRRAAAMWNLGIQLENRLLAWLDRGDAIKFAGVVPTLGEGRVLHDEALQLVGAIERLLAQRRAEDADRVRAAGQGGGS